MVYWYRCVFCCVLELFEDKQVGKNNPTITSDELVVTLAMARPLALAFWVPVLDTTVDGRNPAWPGMYQTL